jgi:hypothetical protein
MPARRAPSGHSAFPVCPWHSHAWQRKAECPLGAACLADLDSHSAINRAIAVSRQVCPAFAHQLRCRACASFPARHFSSDAGFFPPALFFLCNPQAVRRTHFTFLFHIFTVPTISSGKDVIYRLLKKRKKTGLPATSSSRGVTVLIIISCRAVISPRSRVPWNSQSRETCC